MKKKIGLVLLALLVALLPLSGCAGNGDDTTYGEKEMVTPFWTQSKMYNESVMMLKKSGQELASGNLAFEPTGKVTVMSPLMDKVYEEGKDYTISGRTITVTAETSMPWLEEGVLYGIDMPAGKGLSTQPTSAAGKEKGYDTVLYTEGTFLIDNQVLVTYEYDKSDFDSSVIPAYQGDKLPNTLSKLQNKEAVNIIAFGDSISTGCNSTGGGLQSVYEDTTPGMSYYIPFDRAPYTPTFPEMFASELAKHYEAETTIFGAAMGGQTSDWGVRYAADRVVNPDMGYDPDLVTITFGMNDATLGVPLDRFESNMLEMIDSIREKSGKTVEFILIGTMLANPDAVQCTNQEDYWPVLQSVASQREGVVAVDMGAMHAMFLEHKNYSDMIANNINHPNDFLIRMYAMNLLATLIEY